MGIASMEDNWLSNTVSVLIGGSSIWVLNWLIRKNQADQGLLLQASRESLAAKNEIIAVINREHDEERKRWAAERAELVRRAERNLQRIDELEESFFAVKEEMVAQAVEISKLQIENNKLKDEENKK